MGLLFINIDISEIQDLVEIGPMANDAMQKAARDLTAATKAKIVELSNEKLHTRRGKFIEALSHFQLDDNTFVVNLDASARWIDEGMSEHDMLEDLLASKKAKTSKDGKSKYIVVPFQHNAGKQNMSPGQQKLLATIKKELAAVGATPNKLELDGAGKPKLGLVRSLDITRGPPSTNLNPIGRGIGGSAHGPTGIPLLKGVRVYQKEMKDKDGETKVGRFVMTFRVASSKQKNGAPPEEMTGAWKKKHGNKEGPGNAQARWEHPGLEATNLMQSGLDWALSQWESKVAPGIIASLVAKLT